jgi:hypothetical protein
MKPLRSAWLSLFVPSLLMAQPAAPDSPEADIVATLSTEPLPDAEAVPGLLAGQRIMDQLRSVLELVRGGVPDAARPDIEQLDRELRRLQEGEGATSPLPDSYRSDDELWLPVKVQLLQVQLDAPDLVPRPEPGHTGGKVGNLPAKARRTEWLPVSLTAQRVGEVLSLLSSGKEGQERAQQELEAALKELHTSLVLENRRLISAYYAVEAALAAVPSWDDPIREQLREAAEGLAEAGSTKLADRLQTQADRLTPDLRELQALALTLRRQIDQDAGPHTGTRQGKLQSSGSQ